MDLWKDWCGIDSSEGNGLGLSITKSLMELQCGTMNVFIDRDLFKAILTFLEQGMKTL